MYIYCMYYLMEGERAALVGGLLSDYRFSITVFFFPLFETLYIYIYISRLSQTMWEAVLLWPHCGDKNNFIIVG